MSSFRQSKKKSWGICSLLPDVSSGNHPLSAYPYTLPTLSNHFVIRLTVGIFTHMSFNTGVLDNLTTLERCCAMPSWSKKKKTEWDILRKREEARERGWVRKKKRERSGRRKKTLIHGYNCSILNKIFWKSKGRERKGRERMIIQLHFISGYYYNCSVLLYCH